MSANNLTLIGMPGAGKSTLGVVVAKILGMDFLDCDIVIQKQTNKTLQELINAYGPKKFLQLESDCICTLHPTNTVISTGGSAIYKEKTMEHLAALGPIVYLQASLATIDNRLGSLEERGVVMTDGIETNLAHIYDERVPLYEKYASITLPVDKGSIRELALQLVSLVHP